MMKAAMGIMAGLGLAASTQAAVLQIDSITINPSVSGDLKADATITSITVDTVEYTDLESVTSVSFPGNPERLWAQNASDPGSDSAAVVGLNYGTGVLNIGAGTNFQYGRALGLDETLFIIRDGAPSETIELRPITLTNQLIGNYTLSIGLGKFNTFAKKADLNREGGGTLNDRERAGTSFTLGDFTGTIGDLSTAAGFRVTTNGSTFDVTAAGVVVPEPASLALLALGGLMMLPRRKR